MSIGYDKIIIGVEQDGLKYAKNVTGGAFDLATERTEAQVFSNTAGYDAIKTLQQENPDTVFLVLNGE